MAVICRRDSRLLLGLSLLTICYSGAAGQSPASSTETDVWPEVDAYLRLPAGWRMLSFVGYGQAAGYPFQQWYGALGLGYLFKPITRPHLENIDPDKEHYVLFGGGYEHLRTIQSGKASDENRLTIELTPSFRPAPRVLLRDRNWVELRWVGGTYRTVYRNMPSVEVDVLVHGVRFSPYGAVETFYNQDAKAKNSWDAFWYTGGIQWPYKHVFQVNTYYRWEHCATCVPENWNAVGMTLSFFFKPAR
jgi:Protein of unknown function (DUF2490)